MTSLATGNALKGFALKRLFSDRPERSLRLRLLVLLTMLWVALSLNWITGSPWIPLLASLLATGGHLISWRWPGSQRKLRSVVILIAIVGLPIATREDFLTALTGDRLPIAEMLLLIGGIASLRVETRGGLYALLTLSGLVLFFVSERAFDQTFVVFLIVFLGLFLTLFAMAFVEDQLSVARAHWPEGQLSRAWFWSGIVGGGLLVCSALAFSLMPPDLQGRPGSQRVGVVPFMGDSEGFDVPATGLMEPLGPESPFEEDPGLTGVGDTLDGAAPDLSELREFAARQFEGREVDPDPRDTVMHVRSKVTSYWRGRLFDQFDGETWYRSTSSLVERPSRSHTDYYWQAFFLEREQPGAVYAGYNPVHMILPREVRAGEPLPAGSTYSVLSQRPVLPSGSVRADRAGRPSRSREDYLSLPPSSDRVRQVATQVVGDAATPFEQLWRIVSFLRQHHGYDASGQDALQLSGSVEDFLADGRAGTSLDFATATVLMARAVGLPARLAVGYLPGRFDPFSGTHRVREKDTHAWAEVYFARNGWVAFDGTPRPELDRFVTGDLRGFVGASYIFQTRVGGGLYRVLQSGASKATRSIVNAIKEGSGLFAGIGVAILALLLVSTVFLTLRKRTGRTKDTWQYSRLKGPTRREIIETYRRMERLMRRRGLEPRGSSQTIGEYAKAAAPRLGVAGPDLEWMAKAAWVAAYDPAGPSPGLLREAVERLSSLRRALAGQH